MVTKLNRALSQRYLHHFPMLALYDTISRVIVKLNGSKMKNHLQQSNAYLEDQNLHCSV